MYNQMTIQKTDKVKKGEKQQQQQKHHSYMAERRVQIIKSYYDVDFQSELLYDGTHFFRIKLYIVVDTFNLK
jgi:hypothetical protein